MSTAVRNASLSAQVVGVLTIPIYQGGAVYAAARQAKETSGAGAAAGRYAAQRGPRAPSPPPGAGCRRAGADHCLQAAVKAAEIALNGVREEAKVGQRTTLDVLNAQQTLLNTRVQLGDGAA